MNSFIELIERIIGPINTLPYLILSLIIAFTVHEFSHAYVAYRFGDPTAKNEGRLTLNPMSHLDVFGTIMIFIAGFGWAKPVPVNYFYLRNKKYAGVLVSFAGPLSNLLVAFLSMMIWGLLYKIGVLTRIEESTYLAISLFFETLISLNIVLFIFNLLPFPPLDGYRIIEDLAPQHIRSKLIQWEQYGIFIFLILVITPLGDYVFGPLFQVVHPFIFQSISNIAFLIYGI